VAPVATPLHARLEKAGRLRTNNGEVAAVPWTTNIVHPTMSEEVMLAGTKWLANHLYDPELFTERLLTFIDKFGARRDPKSLDSTPQPALRSIDGDTFAILGEFRRLGPTEYRMWRRIQSAILAKPQTGTFVYIALLQYMQIRYMYERGRFWDVEVVNRAPHHEPAPAPLSIIRSSPATPAPSAALN